MHPVDSLAPIVLQAWLLVAGGGILVGRGFHAWRRRHPVDPWRALARRDATRSR